GKMMADTYNNNPRLLPLPRNKEINVKEEFARVAGGAGGHYAQWVEGCIAGYGKKEMSSPFEKAAPLTEALLMANLAIRAHDVNVIKDGKGTFPGRNMKLLWDSQNMKVTNFDDVNQFVKREYRAGWSLGV
ncbi:MAG: gfo/Idh/MocA family oxidoreductase, partial [Pedobacter sp.]